MLTISSVVAGDSSARTTTSTSNTITTALDDACAGGSMSARSKFAHKCDVACDRYRKFHIGVMVQ